MWIFLSTGILLAFGMVPVSNYESIQMDRKPRLTVVPPGPVSDRSRVELRLAIPNPDAQETPITVRFFRNRPTPENQIAERAVVAAPQSIAYVSVWCSAENWAGKQRLVYQVERDGRREEGNWHLEVISANTAGLPRLTGVWIESFAVLRHCQGKDDQETERNIRESVRSMKRLGMKTLILTYLEYQGTFFYPSEIEFYDRDVKKMARGQECPFDLVETFLSQADREGMHVFLGLGRGGDTFLLWEFDKPNWQERNAEAVSLAKRIAQELWTRYRHHPSLYGWYLTHEMNDLKRSSAYYNPLSEFCHSLSPDKPVLVAPAGTPLVDRKLLMESKVDIFAYQDAVGAGYIPYKYTYNPENRIAMLAEIFAKYRSWHADTNKHIWSDLEVWEMDGSKGYSNSYPAAFSRVRRQIEIEARYADYLTAYAYHGYFHDPRSKAKAKDERAVRLFREYEAYLQSRSKR